MKSSEHLWGTGSPSDRNEFRLESLVVQTWGEFRRHMVNGKLLSHFLHVTMDKRTCQAVAESRATFT